MAIRAYTPLPIIYPPTMSGMELQKHEHYMRKCIGLAELARQRGDSPVGSVIVYNDTIVGEGMEGNKTQNDITFHAEIEAIRSAVRHFGKQDLSDCILYTTHEPCIMCAFVIRHHHIKKVVNGLMVGEVGGISSRYPLLRDHSITGWGKPPELVNGILEVECRQLKG